MKFTLAWLKDHLETDAGAAEIGDALTMIGLELEGIEDRAAGLEGFVVARVVEAVPHPNADKLRLCTVDTGGETLQVVCGAPNARTGMKGVFAGVGAYIPGTDLTLRKAAIRGVESNGMLLSEREMGLSDDHEGIVDLPADTPVGARAVDVMGLADPVIDIAITPNRGDCLGVRGIARDLAAAGLGRLKPLDTTAVAGAFASPIGVTLDFPAGHAAACPYFVGRLIRGVRNGPSPDWMQRRLIAVGLRPITALVDITNFMTIDVGRPLHVFDAAKVRGNLTVRFAHPGERLEALNDKTYALDGEMTVIADDHEPEALGGVMGGLRTGCTEETVDVFVESALFDPVRTAATGRRLSLQSDARYRFERGIDPTFLEPGMEMATRLILDLCGGEPSHLVVAGGPPAPRPAITFRPERVRTLGGVDVAEVDSLRILGDLGFAAERSAEGALSVTVPPWRNDVEGEACLVEEVLRINGFDAIPVVPLPRETALPLEALTPLQRRHADAQRVLAARGMTEAVTFSFLPAAHAALFGGGDEALHLVNPISADLDVMRPSILPNLLSACGRNADRGYGDLALFEVGPQYAGQGANEQTTVAAGVRAGRSGPRHWDVRARAVDVFDAKADAQALLAALGAPAAVRVVAEAPAWYHPGRSGTLRLGPKTVLAAFGEVHPAALGVLDVDGPAVAFEVYLDAIPLPRARAATTRPAVDLPDLQPLVRDFAFVVDADLPAEDLERAVRGAHEALIVDARVFDVFTGGSLGEGRKSLAVAATLQPRDRTLTDADLEDLARRIVDRVRAKTGGTLRT